MATTRTQELASEFDADLSGELPETLDWAAVERMRVVARVLDESIPVPGTSYRIGVDPIVGVLPGAGDVVTGAVSLYIVAESARLGVAWSTLVEMLENVSVDVIGGSVPLIGPVFDAAYKSNKYNMRLFLEDLATGADGEPAEPVTIDVD